MTLPSKMKFGPVCVLTLPLAPLDFVYLLAPDFWLADCNSWTWILAFLGVPVMPLLSCSVRTSLDYSVFNFLGQGRKRDHWLLGGWATYLAGLEEPVRTDEWCGKSRHPEKCILRGLVPWKAGDRRAYHAVAGQCWPGRGGIPFPGSSAKVSLEWKS